MENLAMNGIVDPSFWQGKKVFLTGHTGFKGGWLATWLSTMGAELHGFSLSPSANRNLFEVASIASLFSQSTFADIRNINSLHDALIHSSPDIVIHMAAQSLVRYSYKHPVETYATNVMGTVNLLESLRDCPSVKSALIITTDKCYENREWVWGYRELDSLGGYDPYSNSKACAEMVVSTYRQSFFADQKSQKTHLKIATCRAGNVIGGGDWSQDRLIPDALAAFESGESLLVRNPLATRPWQHVMEPLSGYLLLAQALYQKGALFDGAWNFGPNDEGICSVEQLINLLIAQWRSPVMWRPEEGSQPHEANSLRLDSSKARRDLGWNCHWTLERSIKETVDWHNAFQGGQDMLAITKQQIKAYITS